MSLDRRDFIKFGLVGGLKVGTAVGALGTLACASSPQLSQRLLSKPIPSTGEQLPVIGFGTNRYGTGSDPEIRETLLQVLHTFSDAGGTLLDSSSHYRGSEDVLGELFAELELSEKVFVSTKAGRFDEGSVESKMANSLARLRVDKIDLYMIHNAADQDWQAMLPKLREWKQEGIIHYLGVTTSEPVEHPEILKIMRTEPLDFVQLNYNLGDRSSEAELIPLAKENGIAVVGNVPFGQGALFQAVSGLELPAFANEFCQSWGNFFLKYIISHPDIVATIPGTTKPHHALDNLQAGMGRMPTAAERQMQEEFIASL